MDYYEHVASLPDNLREINEFCWDMTGRPNFNHSYQIALGRLCAISNDWVEFDAYCDKFFFNSGEMGKPLEREIAWHCYIKGMHVLTDKLSEKA